MCLPVLWTCEYVDVCALNVCECLCVWRRGTQVGTLLLVCDQWPVAEGPRAFVSWEKSCSERLRHLSCRDPVGRERAEKEALNTKSERWEDGEESMRKG